MRSIMSGLKISARSRLSEKRLSRFDSILVRLKAQLNPTISFLHEPFLFHAGSIKSQPKGTQGPTRYRSFDSILVRLKAKKVTFSGMTERFSFDSILVRLKDIPDNERYKRIKDVRPISVRVFHHSELL